MIDPNTLDPLLAPLPEDVRALLRIVGKAMLTIGGPPVYQYVQGELGRLGYDAEAVFGRLPTFAAGHTVYTLARRDRSGLDHDPVKLTIAGMAHLPELESTVAMFLRVVRELAIRRANAPFDPARVISVKVAGVQLVADLGLHEEPLVGLLPDLLQGEPSTWIGAHASDETGWAVEPSALVRHFATVTDVNDYVTRLRDWMAPAVPVCAPKPVSPFGLVVAFDYLDVVWQLQFGRKLVHLPSAERVASLTVGVAGVAEFTDRLSALGEMFKGLDVPASGNGTFDRLLTYLPLHLPPAAMPRIRTAIDLLRKATDLRNGGQHYDAASQAARALPTFGLTFPISDHAAAWQAVQAHVIAALDTIREEIRAATPIPTPRTAQRRRRPPRPAATRSTGR
jgi:hypothetical protein